MTLTEKEINRRIKIIVNDVKEFQSLEEKVMVDSEVSLEEAIKDLIERVKEWKQKNKSNTKE